MPLQRVPINNFRGGLNTREGPFDLQPNESPDLSNVTISNLVGQLQVRQGITFFAGVDADEPNAQAQNMQQVVLNVSTRFIIFSVAGNIHILNIGDDATTLIYTGTANTVWSFAQYPDADDVDHVWCLNGTDPPQKYDGTSIADWVASNGDIPSGNMLKVYGNRLFIVGATSTPQRIFFSPFGDPEATTDVYGFIDLRGPEDELDSFIDLAELGTRLYAFKRESVWVINDPSTLANRRLGAPGVAGRFMVTEMNAKLYWFNGQGLWSTAGVAIAYESGSINNWFPQHMNYSAIETVRLLATRDSYQRLFLIVPSSISTFPDVLIEVVPNINFRRIGGRRYLLLPAFFLHTISMQSFCNVNIQGNGPWTVVGSATDQSALFTLFKGSDDNGIPITAYWKSAWMAIQGEEPFERIRRCNVELYGDAIVDIYKDFNPSPDFSATLPNPLSSQDSIWDNSPHIWDDGGIWDPPGAYRFARVRPDSRGRFHQIGFRTLPSGGIPFLINVAEFAIRGGKEH